MAVESVVAIGSGVLAGSILLTAFGFDSVIELISAGVLLRRLRAEAHQALDAEELDRVERRASRISAVLLALLCLYVLGSALLGLVTRLEPERSLSGLAVSAAALLVMPLLGWRKRVIAERIGRRALRADAAESITCAYMAGEPCCWASPCTPCLTGGGWSTPPRCPFWGGWWARRVRPWGPPGARRPTIMPTELC